MGKALAILAGLAVLALTAVGTATVAYFLWHAGAPGGTHSSIEAPYTVLDPNTGEYVQYLDGPPPAAVLVPESPEAAVFRTYVAPEAPSAPSAPPNKAQDASPIPSPAILLGLYAVFVTAWLIVSRLRSKSTPCPQPAEADELSMVREIHGSLGRMEQRIEALETLLLDRPVLSHATLKEDR